MAGEKVIQYMEALTGGASNAVDGIDGNDRGDGEAIALDDITYANVSGVHHIYKYTATAAVESVPDIIRPDVNNDPTKAWILQGATFNSVITAGSGILFGSDTAAANTLDDYEEGFWIPAGLGTGGTYNASKCIYTKIGNQVVLYFDVTFGTSAGTTMTGAPYTASVSGAGFVGYTDAPVTPSMFINVTTTTFYNVSGAAYDVSGYKVTGTIMYTT
ncbi:MAG: hypothetical protein GY853_02000 [PVC group bacterium]|nr:hypothetical protein [PVC group bacterium]